MWNCKSVSVVPIVFGAFGAITKNLMMWVTNAVFRLERATEVLELTYLGKYFACVNAN